MSDFIGEGAYIKDVDGYQFLIGNVRHYIEIILMDNFETNCRVSIPHR